MNVYYIEGFVKRALDFGLSREQAFTLIPTTAGAVLGGTLGHGVSKKNKMRNALLGALAGGTAGFGGAKMLDTGLKLRQLSEAGPAVNKATKVLDKAQKIVEKVTTPDNVDKVTGQVEGVLTEAQKNPKVEEIIKKNPGLVEKAKKQLAKYKR